MPRNVVKEVRTAKQFTLNLAEQLRSAARHPTIDRYEPHEKQLEFHKSTKSGRQVLGGNRSGKTVGGAAEIVFYATGKHPYKRIHWEPPLRLRVVTTDLIHGLEGIVKPEIRRWIPPSALINNSWEDSYSKQLRTLTLDNGSFIEFMTYEQELDTFAGTSRHGVWFDEEPPKDIWTECKLRLLDVNGDWWITMTPVEGMTWTFTDIYELDDPNIDIIEVDMDDNPHLSQEGKETVLAGLSDDEKKIRKQGLYISLGGLIYPEEFQVIDPIIPPFDWLWVGSMDHGIRNPTCWLWSAIDETGRIIVFDEHYKSDLLIKDHARIVHEKNAQHGRVPNYNVGDPSIRAKDPITGTSIHIEYAQNGVPIVLGNNDVRAGLDRVKKLAYGEKKLYITRNCEKLLWERKRYRWASWATSKQTEQKNKKEEPIKKDDHAMDSLRYMVSSRPEKDVGQRVPPVGNSDFGASEAIGPKTGLTDKEASRMSSRKTHDVHLGSEY